jgi:ketosteroid isomerase-like protein
MNRFLSVGMVLLVGVFALAQFGCASPSNPPATNASMATPEATPDAAAIERELLRIENDWPRVIKERDGQAVRRVDAEDVHLLSWDGSITTKEEDAKFIESGAFTLDSMQMNELKVKVLGKDAAVVTGLMVITNGKIKAPNQTVNVSGQYRFVDTFARQNNEWRLVASSSVKLANPVSLPSPTPRESPSMPAGPATKPTPTTRATPAAKPSAAKPPAAKTATAPRPQTPPMPVKTP